MNARPCQAIAYNSGETKGHQNVWAGRREGAGKITGELLPADTARLPDGCKGQFPELLVIGSPNSVPGK